MSEQRIEQWPLGRLRPHPENTVIFGDPEEAAAYDDVRSSIRRSGINEPLCVRADGTILSGHLRYACARSLKMAAVPVRVVDAFTTYLDEIRFVIESNTARRQLTRREIGLAMNRLKQIPREQGGAKAKMGRPKSPSPGTGLSESRSEAAKMLGVGRKTAEACETVFTTPGVPEELKKAVDKGRVAPTAAAKEVKAEVRRQGGEIKAPTALVGLATQAPKARPAPQAVPPAETHEQRLRRLADEYQRDFVRLHKAYKEVDAVLSTRPLHTLLGPTEHHEYAQLIRDIAIRASRELEQAKGTESTGRQITFSVVTGGGR